MAVLESVHRVVRWRYRIWAPLDAVDSLDWVDGDPKLLRLALEARAACRPFSLYLDAE